MRHLHPAISLLLSLIIFSPNSTLHAQEPSRAFEFRYVTDNVAANGETDFKGETAIFNTEDRVRFLAQYAEFGKRFWNDPGLDTKVVEDTEVQNALQQVKPQPLPTVRTQMPLDSWKWLGYKAGDRRQDLSKMHRWPRNGGAQINNGSLVIARDNAQISQEFTPQSWRFSMEWRAQVSATDQPMVFELSDGGKVPAITVGVNSSNALFYSEGSNRQSAMSVQPDTWYHFKIEVDVPAARYTLYINDERVAYYVPTRVSSNNLSKVSTLTIRGMEGQQFDDVWGVGYSPTGRVRRPYNIATFLDEDFEATPSIRGWTDRDYDDSQWEITDLPKAHGSERFAGEDLYLRKTVEMGEFEKAILNVEALDPGGEIWVNGALAGQTANRHPMAVDVTEHLHENATNVIAVKVNHFYLTEDKGSFMGHTPLDLNFGWFAGRMSLDLTSDRYIQEVFAYTTDISNPATVHMRMQIRNDHWWALNGQVDVALYPWFPEESSQPAAEITQSVVVEDESKAYEFDLSVPDPVLWTTDEPYLYKVVVILRDANGEALDDYVLTTGIRTISQKNGNFHVNGKPAMLNGAQIFGARAPLSKTIEWYRCPPIDWVAREIQMIKKMNGNLLRVHVHAWQNPAAGVNDPRYAELGDQLGMMFIWSTTAWIRTGKGWGQIDFDGYPKYMQQVQNHPSIVMWEISNHPTGFRTRSVAESDAFVRKAYHTVHDQDPSRIISFTSYIHRLKYANDAGTLDHEGNRIDPAPEWTAPGVTRGNQDSYAGYGREWDVLRKAPNFEYRPHLPGFLNSPERAYFNFEHEESIGQPNWNLVKGKPWYQLQSYEWDYDTGSIGRRLQADEWEESQAWQAFSAYEAMRKQRWLDYDGFSWCCLHGGPNTVTYKKPIIDFLGHAKLAYWANKMAFQHVLAGSDNVDVAYGPEDVISPAVLNLGEARTVNLTVSVKDMAGKEIDRTEYRRVELPAGRTVTELEDWTPSFAGEGYYGIEYTID